MWDKFTPDARDVVFHAQEEAGRRGQNFVATEHLLLGLLRDPQCAGLQILTALGCDPRVVRARVNAYPAQTDPRLSDKMELTPRAKRVIDLAYSEMKELGHTQIGSEHLLLGLIREDGSIAGLVLASLGIEIGRVRGIVKHGGAGATWPPPPQPSRPTWEQYTPHARNVIHGAQQAAQQLGSAVHSTEHLLLGILSSSDSGAITVLNQCGCSPDAIRTEIGRQISTINRSSSAEIKITPAGKRAIDLAYEEAALLGAANIGSEHFLLGLIREDDGIAGTVLRGVGMDIQRARAAVKQLPAVA